MRKSRSGEHAPRSQQEHGQDEGTPATREDVLALIRQFNYPHERGLVDDWPGVAKALVRAARGFGIVVPFYLARAAGFPAPPPPLRLVRGGRRDDDGIGSEHPFPPVP